MHSLAAVVLSAVAVLLIGLGIVRTVNVYEQYRSDMLAYESRHLNSIVSTSARGMSWMISGYKGQTEALMGRVEFQEAEDAYFASGSTEELRQLVSHPDFLGIGMKCKLVIYDQFGTVLAATDNEFPEYRYADVFMGDGIVIREQDGSYWLVFGANSERGLHYELALSVRSVFSAHADAVRIGENGYIFLMDRNRSFLSVSSDGQTVTYSMAALEKEFPAVDSVAMEEIASGGPRVPEDYYVFPYPWEDEGSAAVRSTLVSTYAVDVGEKGFVMGAAISFSEFDAILTDMLNNVVAMIILELAGAALLMLILSVLLVRNRRSALQMEVFRQKAELMEEVNRQQQSLQHSARLQQLGVMTSGIAHEFNNLMTPIMGQSMLLLEELADKEDSPEFESALEIYEASEKARSIIRGMSSMGKKDMDMSMRTIDVAGLLRQTMNLAAMAKSAHIQQELVGPEEPVFVSGSEQLLGQAFMNLFINGFQAMGDEGKLTVTVTSETRSGIGYVRVEVRDSGPGIPQSKLGQIYEEFYTTKGEQGTGLGLVICQKIIETHKGTISAENHPEGGAVFTVRLPVTELFDDE